MRTMRTMRLARTGKLRRLHRSQVRRSDTLSAVAGAAANYVFGFDTQKMAPGSRMYLQMDDPAQRRQIVAYLQAVSKPKT